MELREEKGAKSESSPSPGLPYERESQWDPSSHQHYGKTNERLSGIDHVLHLLSTCMPSLHMLRPVIQDFIMKSHIVHYSMT